MSINIILNIYLSVKWRYCILGKIHLLSQSFFLKSLVDLNSNFKKTNKPLGNLFTAFHVSNAVLVTSTVQLECKTRKCNVTDNIFRSD